MLRARPAAAAALTTAAACTRTALAVTRFTALPRSRPSTLPVFRAEGQNSSNGKMWTFAGGGRDQRSLVDYLVSQRRGGRAGVDVSPVAIEAMKAVDRKEFIGPVEESRANIYLVSGTGC